MDEDSGRNTAPDLEAALAALGRAERSAAPPPAWTLFVARLERPSLTDRLPLVLATAVRSSSDLARPAMAGTLVAMSAGVALGTWLALALDRGPAATALESTSYAGSSLLTGDGPGLDTYLGVVDSEDSSGDTLPEPGAGAR